MHERPQNKADGCTATATRTGPGSFTIDVTTTLAGTSTVTVGLADPSGAVLTTSAEVVTAKPTAVSLVRDGSLNGTAYAVTPGASFSWCAGLADTTGPLAYDDGDLTVSVVGATLRAPWIAAPYVGPRYSSCFSFDAVESDPIQVQVSSATTSRRETVRVVDASDIVRAEVLAGVSSVSGTQVPVEQDPLEGYGGSDRIAIDSCTMHAMRIVLRGFTREGFAVLAPVSHLSISPKELVFDPRPESGDPTAQSFDVTPLARGEGVLRGDIGHASFTTPLTVTGNCVAPLETPDAGIEDEDADADADAAPDAGP